MLRLKRLNVVGSVKFSHPINIRQKKKKVGQWCSGGGWVLFGNLTGMTEQWALTLNRKKRRKKDSSTTGKQY